MARNLWVIDVERHERAQDHLRVICRDGEITASELAAHAALLAQNITEADDDRDQQYVRRAMDDAGTDTEHVRTLLLRRWTRKGLVVIEGGKSDDEPLSAA